MKTKVPFWTIVLMAMAWLVMPPICAVQTISQTITLQPGWNAVWLEVQPSNNTANAVFAGLPIASVWMRAERLSSVDYIQNASEQNFNEAGWLRWFHPSRSEAFLNNLFAVFANRAYLIKSTNVTSVIWNIVGRPALNQPAWVPDSYNLCGLAVAATNPPTFANFFRYSKAHFNPATGLMQKIYRLDGSGQWTQVTTNELTQSGAAYWIYSQGASDYVAPLTASVDLGDGLDFDTELIELNLRLANKSTSPMNALVKEMNASGPGALAYYQFVTNSGGQWPNLPGTLVQTPATGGESRVRLAIRRQNFGSNDYSSVLEIRDGAGTRLLVPVKASGGSADTPAGPLNEAKAHAGLWVGNATINAVSEAHSANPTNPTPTKSEMNLRLLLHVDANGQTRLLKEVIQMWRDGTYTNDGSGNLVTDQPGRYVLLTDDTLIGQFQGATLRDGEPVGRRSACGLPPARAPVRLTVHSIRDTRAYRQLDWGSGMTGRTFCYPENFQSDNSNSHSHQTSCGCSSGGHTRHFTLACGLMARAAIMSCSPSCRWPRRILVTPRANSVDARTGSISSARL